MNQPQSPVSLKGRRVLVTQATDFMGPALCQMLGRYGAEVIADAGALDGVTAAAEAIARAGEIDTIVANLGISAPTTRVGEVDEDEWHTAFAHMVDPLPRLLKAVLPAWRHRGRGDFLVMGSASALRGMRRTSTYSAARGAQLAWAQAVGVELAGDNIRVNAIAQNFVDNPTYFPESLQANPAFQERLRREVPLGRLVAADEDAAFAGFLLSDAARCFVGQVFPVCGGWVTR
ncbi:MAG: SDR family oxidoreductase [Burkholderiaceae bacterium]